MCLASSLIGTFIYLRKQSLVGEALSHATYPGVILGVIALSLFAAPNDSSFLSQAFILVGAASTAALGMLAINFLEKKVKIRSDSALCMVLSSFFGIGVLLASQVQFSHTGFYKLIQVYLYGQAATMTDTHMILFFSLSLLVSVLIFLFYKELKAVSFDRAFAQSLGIRSGYLDLLLYALLVLALVTGIRSVGVVLMSAMLIAPPVAARQFTNRLSRMLLLAALFGSFSGLIGTWASSFSSVALPTGPLIVMISSLIAFLALLFAPERGLFIRFMRSFSFRVKCLSENVLKAMWRSKKIVSLNELQEGQSISKLILKGIMFRLVRAGWVEKAGTGYGLTAEGNRWAERIVRLHRLWEVYLVDYVGLNAEKVHKSAEEMEHIITPELEKELMLLLKNPERDPHNQPIPL
jgi:manganese/zinc/iron transport system permease protein